MVWCVTHDVEWKGTFGILEKKNKEQLSNLKTTTTLTNKISLSWLKTSDDHESVLRNEKLLVFY